MKNEQEILDAWASYDQKLESMLAVNQANTLELSRLRVSMQLASIKPSKWFAIVCGVVWCVLLGGVFALSLMHSPRFYPFVAFVFGLLAINVTGVAMYIYHLILIEQVDNGDSVLAVQSGLAKLKNSTLGVTRVLILQIPFFAALHWFIVDDPGVAFWIVNLAIMAVFIIGTIWLFSKIDEKNRDEKWFRALFGDREWDGVVKSIEMLEEIETLKSIQETE